MMKLMSEVYKYVEISTSYKLKMHGSENIACQQELKKRVIDSY